MHLFEAILAANHKAIQGDANAVVARSEFPDALPIAALTCIDPRLNHLFPNVLGITEEEFIWLRNAGNVVTGPLSSTVRSLGLACLVKGAREIVIIGHTDCLVRKASMLQLTERFKSLGLDRSKLPDNLAEYFGLFASETQNVIRGVTFLRESPVIGTNVPVHGLIVNVETGQLDWVVNGYDTFAAPAAASPHRAPMASYSLPSFDLNEKVLPQVQIGSHTLDPNALIAKLPGGEAVMEKVEAARNLAKAAPPVLKAARELLRGKPRH